MRPTKECAVCKRVFEKPYTSSKKIWAAAKYCSRACAVVVTGIKKGERLPPHIHRGMIERNKLPRRVPPRDSYRRGADHHNYKGGKITLNCKQCGSEFLVRPYRAHAQFCSYRCKAKAQDRGISSANEKARKSIAYREWRTAVFERDDYTCQECGVRSGNGRAVVLNADHITPFSLFPELRFDLDNGRTLCKPCHVATPTYGVGAWRCDAVAMGGGHV